MQTPRTLAVVLAGGEGSRMGPLTDHRAKPSLRLAGTYRLIDVALSNLTNSGISDVWLVEQYQPRTLNDHLSAGRPWDLDRSHGGLQILAPFTGSDGEGLAHGNSDSLWRQRHHIADFGADLVIVLSADHLYTIDLRDVVATHRDADADLTIVTTRTDQDASAHGVVEAAEDGTVTGFWYKPEEPSTDVVAAEIFCFDARALTETLGTLHDELGELSDYGDDLIPHFVEHRRTVEHRLQGYWIDMGTPSTYWQAHMDLLDRTGAHLDDPRWPIYSAQPHLVPARVEAGAEVADSLLSPGSVVAGSVHRSVVGPGAVIEASAEVSECVILDGARIPAGARLRRFVVDVGARPRVEDIGSASRITVIDRDGQAVDD